MRSSRQLLCAGGDPLFGYPSHSIGKGQKNRKPLSEIASLEHFGIVLASHKGPSFSLR